MTPAETRFLIDFATVASTTGGSSGPTTAQRTQVAVSTPDGAAQLAPHSLGVTTGSVGPAVA